MTAEPAPQPGRRRLRGVPGESYEQRFARYAYNAGATARFSDRDAARQRRAAEMHARASFNADDHDDPEAAYLYDQMKAAALDAADALDDLAALARQVAKHYESTAAVTGEQEINRS